MKMVQICLKNYMGAQIFSIDQSLFLPKIQWENERNNFRPNVHLTLMDFGR